MSRCYAVLVDAGFLKRQLGTQNDPATFAAIDAFLNRLTAFPALSDLTLHRIYFYDAAPLGGKKVKPLRGGEVDFGASEVATRNAEIHKELRKRPFVALRLGELAFRGWRLKPFALQRDAERISIAANDLVPNMNQKGVDMRVGLDIAALSLKRLVQVVVLVAGDSDFIPAMKFARREGLQLFLAPLGRAVHEGMLEHSDLILDISAKQAPNQGRNEA